MSVAEFRIARTTFNYRTGSGSDRVRFRQSQTGTTLQPGQAYPEVESLFALPGRYRACVKTRDR